MRSSANTALTLGALVRFADAKVNEKKQLVVTIRSHSGPIWCDDRL